MWESNAILRYICNTFSLDDSFYPTSPAERARLEMALDWRQTTLYPHIARAAYPALGFSQVWASPPQARPGGGGGGGRTQKRGPRRKKDTLNGEPKLRGPF